MSKKNPSQNPESALILSEVKTLIAQSKQEVALAVNATITQLYWSIGKRINQEILQYKRAEYGKQIISTLSVQLTQEYGKGWSEKQLRQCIQFATAFPGKQIVYTLCIELSWIHLKRD